MKNIIIKFTVVVLSLISLSCSKELDYGSDFEFKINNIDNNSIVINTEKTFQLELTKFFNETSSKKFDLSYDSENISLISENITLLKGVKYSFTFSELSILTLKLISSQKGDFTLTIKLTDINGLEKEQKVIVKSIEDMNYSFVQEQAQPNYEDILSTTFTLNFNLKDIGSGGDSYKIRATPSLSGTILINNSLVQPKQLINAALGNISVSFTPDLLGKQSLTLTVVNSKNLEKEITLDFTITQKQFTVASSKDFEVKQTLNKQFSFVTTGTIPNWTYQVMFKSTAQAKLYSSVGAVIPLNTYVDLPVNTSTFNFIYESQIIGLDALEIFVRDKNGQTVTNKVGVNIVSKPTFSLTAKAYIDPGLAPYFFNYLNAFYSFENVKAYGTNSTITQFEFKVFNYKTKVFDTFTENTKSFYPFEIYSPSNDAENEKRKNYYGSQAYSARVKDSDGVWSDTLSGTMAK